MKNGRNLVIAKLGILGKLGNLGIPGEVNSEFQVIILCTILKNDNSEFFRVMHRVATDLENLEKSGNLKVTSKSHGICLKSQGICDRIPKVRESQGILFSEIHFQPS